MAIVVPFVAGMCTGSLVTWSVGRREMPGFLKFSWLRRKKSEDAEVAETATADAVAEVLGTDASASATA